MVVWIIMKLLFGFENQSDNFLDEKISSVIKKKKKKILITVALFV